MARSITLIQKDILDGIASNKDLAALNSTSKTAIYRLIAFAVSFAIFVLEQMFDLHKTQIDQAIYDNKPGTTRWYRNMALKFQDGFKLLTDDDEFDNTHIVNGQSVSYTTDEIEASKIIKYCSVKQSLESSRLIIKVAGESGSTLVQLTTAQIERFRFYIGEIVFAGVKVLTINNPADKLLLNLRVYRNPLLIDAFGISVKNGGNPVDAALKTYMKNLPFDGELVINDMIDYLRDVPGVQNVHVISAQSSYKDLVTGLFTAFKEIDVETIPIAGYFAIETTSIISYVV